MIDYKNSVVGYKLLGKRIIRQPNPQLQRLPCSDFDFVTCKDRLFHATLAEEPYNCKVSIFDSGQHLQSISSKELSECSNNITYEVNFQLLTCCYFQKRSQIYCWETKH